MMRGNTLQIGGYK